MSLKTILVCLTTREHAATLLKVAVPLARKHNAHLIGLHTMEALMVYPGIAMHVPEPAFASFNKHQKQEALAIKQIFDDHVHSEDFPLEWRELLAESNTATDRMVECARAADIVVMAHEDQQADRYDQRHAQAQVIRDSGRPVIVVPLDYDGPAIGQNIVLGWSNTREATRAAHDLTLMADKGASVTLLRVGTPGPDELKDFDTIDIAEMLTRHGLKTEIQYRAHAGQDVASVLNACAFEQGADMIVTGAFGHSRVFDFVIGAASYALLDDARFPVMFSK